MLPIGGSGDFGTSPFFRQLTEQAAGLPVFDQVACRTRSTIAAVTLIAGVLLASFHQVVPL
jgi:hypothetical protein